MPKVCEFCDRHPASPRKYFHRKKLPRRRFHSVYFPGKYGDKIIRVCRTCFIGGKRIHIFYPAKPPRKP